MAKQIIEVSFYSPRWGHEDLYRIQLESNTMTVDGLHMGKNAVCSLERTWSGYNDKFGNPLEKILENDGINPPSNFVIALEQAWIAWIEGRLDNDQVQSEIQELCNWLNTVTQSKPSTDFWKSVGI
jgi:hypothetical protein